MIRIYHIVFIHSSVTDPWVASAVWLLYRVLL